MQVDSARIEEVFSEALSRSDAAARAAYLDEACGGDLALLERVEALLAAHEATENRLVLPEANGATVAYVPLAEGPGTKIGRYKLLEQIGEGGFGVVFMAEQEEPVRRRVALKIIKLGMDTKQVVARFEAERQALAMMDHPNIAKVLDGGSTDTGRPYFVMELVRGIPITDYCDQNKLSTVDRLKLFITVCSAVQHAHQKGIIHRDLKPTNVLVTLHDDRPVPKIIDFGIAKATQARLTEKTLFTEFRQMIGTPAYMSPEQAQMSGIDVDTRSDIYSLGVLLYELLAGSTPFASKELLSAGFAEMQRMIREVEPPKPSTRLSSSDALPSIAANRGLEPVKLNRLVQGELDWIVMKALEKDRNRRYATATGLAQDIAHYLADEPVEACPPSARYRLGKFGRRNKAALAVAALVLFFLVVLGGVAGWEVRGRSARQAKLTGQLELILDEVARLEQREKWSEALVSAQRAEPALAAGEAAPEIQERARQTLADLELVHQLDEIRAHSGTAWVYWTSRDPRRNPLAVQAELDYAAAFRKSGIDLDALPLSEAIHRITAHEAIASALLPAIDDWVAVRSIVRNEAETRRLIDVLHGADPDPWRQRVRDALGRKDWPALDNLVTSAELDRQPAATLTALYAALPPSGQQDEQEMVLRRAQWKYPADYWINTRLGVFLIWLGSPERKLEGMGYIRAAIALRPEDAQSIFSLGNGYAALGQHDQAIACFRKAAELEPKARSVYLNLGNSLWRTGQYEETIAAFEQCIALTPDYAPELAASACSALSMVFSNCPKACLRNTHQALELANKAVELEPQDSNNWTALGVAHYRNSQWQEARSDFDKSLQLGTGGRNGAFRWADSIDWFFVAMSNWQLGDKEEARKCYDHAVQGMELGQTWQTDVEQLHRFRTEAEDLISPTVPAAGQP